MLLATSTNLKSRTAILLGTSAIFVLALMLPVIAEDFSITDATTTNNGETINGNDTVKISGDLELTNATGIETTGNSNTITLSKSGSIKTVGNSAYGIHNSGDNSTTSVSGSITTEGVNSEGILNEGGANKTNLSGSIVTSGEDSAGIVNEDGDGNTTAISTTGSITTTGDEGFGLLNESDRNTTTVEGSIETQGEFAVGISNEGDSNKTTVSGSIKTEGDSSPAIFIAGDKNVTTVSGNITSEGNSGDAIRNFGDSNATKISGTVSATGTNASAFLNMSGSGNSLRLDEGAVIIGDISAFNAATNNKLVTNLGSASSFAYTVGGAGTGRGAGEWNFTDKDGRTLSVSSINSSNCTANETAAITTCNLVTGVSTGNVEAQDELQFGINTAMISSLLSTQSKTWANVYGDTSKRIASTTKLELDASNSGLTIGTTVLSNDAVNLDLAFNASNTDFNIGSAKEQEITVESYNIGAVLRDLVPSDAWSIDAFGFVGSNSYEGKRKVMNNKKATGSESVTASYSGTEVLVGVNALYSQAIVDTLNFTGGVNANLSNEKIDAYSESKYYSWDERTMTQASGGINLGLEYNKDALTTFANLGLQLSSLQKGETTTYTNNGTSGSFTDSSTGDTRRSISVGFSYAGSENLSLKGAVEAFTSENGMDGNSANLSAIWEF